MPECFKEFITELVLLVPVIILAGLGGIVNYLNRPRAEFSIWWLAVGLITAIFVGIVIHYLLQATTWPDGIQAAVVSLSGYASRDVLYILKARLIKNVCRGDLP